jgi:hypothetical protein
MPLPQFDVDAGGRLVEAGSAAHHDGAFAIITRRFIPPDSVTILESFFSHATVLAPSRYVRVAGLPNRPRLPKADGGPRFERVGMQLLHQSITPARRA